jgi:ketosteroid isomerase-like protein
VRPDPVTKCWSAARCSMRSRLALLRRGAVRIGRAMRIRASTKSLLLLGSLLLAQGCDGKDEPAPGNAAASTEPGGSDGQLPEPRGRPVAGRDSGRARDEAELIRVERDYAAALVNKDRAFLMRFYAADWRGGNWMGFWSKSTMLKSVLNQRYVVRSMRVLDLKVRVMGDVAIVQGVDEEISSVDGKDTSGKWSFTDIFARRAGGWTAIAGHTSEVKPTGA